MSSNRWKYAVCLFAIALVSLFVWEKSRVNTIAGAGRPVPEISSEPCEPCEECETCEQETLVRAAPTAKTVRIIVNECCRSDLIELQYKLFDRFLLDDFEIYVVLSADAAKSSIASELQTKANTLGFKIVNCPANELAVCYNFCYDHLVFGYE